MRYSSRDQIRQNDISDQRFSLDKLCRVHHSTDEELLDNSGSKASWNNFSDSSSLDSPKKS
jgi:hypothetical protein